MKISVCPIIGLFHEEEVTYTVDITFISVHLFKCKRKVDGICKLLPVMSWRSVLLVGKLKYSEKTSELSQVIDKRYYIMLHQVHLTMNGIRTHNVRSDMHCLQLPYDQEHDYYCYFKYIRNKLTEAKYNYFYPCIMYHVI